MNKSASQSRSLLINRLSLSTIAHVAFYVALLTFSAQPAHAQNRKPSAEALEELGSLNNEVEAAPKPEYPYPGTVDPDYAPTPNPNQQAKRLEAEPTPPPTKEVPRPKRVDENGNYFYGTEVETSKGDHQPGVAHPVKAQASGEFVYDPNDKSTEPQEQPIPGAERPVSISPSGEYSYKLPKNKHSHSSSFRFGIMSPPKITNADFPQIDFAAIYTNANQPALLGDYEWRLSNKIGRLGLKFGSGVFFAAGTGQFVTPRPEQTKALEKFTFLMIPNSVTAIYKFQYAEKQLFVPYIEGGAALFGLVEIRDDGKAPKLGVSPGLVAAGGINMLLDGFDPRAIQKLDAQYGIGHVWLTAEFRNVVGLNSKMDISGYAISVGVVFDF